MNHRLCTKAAVAIVTAFLLAGSGNPAFARRILATSADDVCAPDADPCVISTKVIVRDGAVLDFGTRMLQVVDRGTIRIHGDHNEILCGQLLIDTPGRSSIRMRKGSTRDAVVDIAAYRTCTDGVTRCLFGHECGTGTCSLGSGNIEIDGDIRMTFVDVAALGLLAAGSIDLRGDLTEAGVAYPELYVSAEFGSLTVEGDLRFGSGAPYVALDSDWGDLVIDGDIVLRSDVEELSTVDLFTADGDIVLNGNIDVTAGMEGGWGGEILIEAFDELRINSGAPGAPQRIVTNGSQGGIPGEGGGGGYVDALAGSIVVGPNVEIEASASSLRNQGGQIFLYSDYEGTEFAGKATATGDFAGIDFNAYRDLDLLPGSSVTLLSHPDVVNGTLALASKYADVRAAGLIRVDGGNPSNYYETLEVKGCNVLLASGSNGSANAAAPNIKVLARESFTLEAGASLQNWTGGIDIRYRPGSATPILTGSASPTPVLISDASLTSCAP